MANTTFGRHDIWPTRHLANTTFGRQIFGRRTFGRHEMSPTRHLADTTFGRHGIWPTDSWPTETWPKKHLADRNLADRQFSGGMVLCVAECFCHEGLLSCRPNVVSVKCLSANCRSSPLNRLHMVRRLVSVLECLGGMLLCVAECVCISVPACESVIVLE